MLRTRNIVHAVFFITLLFSFPAAGAAFNWDAGGTFYNSTGLVSDEFSDDAELEQLNVLTLRAEAFLRAETGTSVTLSAQGRYEYTNERAYLFDLDQLRIRGTFPELFGGNSVAEASAGRFFFSDPSGMILSHTADGGAFRAIFPGVRILAAGGYTGLIINPSSEIAMTNIDLTEKGLEIEDNFFGSKRAFFQANFMFPEFLWLDAFTFFTLFQFDMRDKSEGTVMNSQYAGFLSERSYGRNLYQDLFIIAQYAQYEELLDDYSSAGLLFGIRFRYLNEDLLGSRFMLRALAAPPKFKLDDVIDVPFGSLGFVPMNQPSLGKAVSPQLAGLGMIEAGYSFRPFIKSGSEIASRIQPSIGARGYLRTFWDPVDWIGTDPDSDSLFLGTEVDAGLAWRILSDLGLDINGAYFIPGPAANPDMETVFAVRCNLSISF